VLAVATADSGSGRTGVKADASPSEREPPCRLHTSHRNCWIASSTFYTTVEQHLGAAASPPNRGFRVPEATFSPTSSSTPKKGWNHGKRCFRILQHLPLITLKLCSLIPSSPSQLQTGSRVFPMSCTSVVCVKPGLPPWSHSMDSRPSLNLSSYISPSFRPRSSSTSSFPSLFSRT